MLDGLQRSSRLLPRPPSLEPRRQLRTILDGFAEHRLLTYASAISFQVATAIVPLVLLLLGLAGTLHLETIWSSGLRPEAVRSLSPSVMRVVDETVAGVLSSRQLFWVTAGLALAVWQVSGAVRATMELLNEVRGTEETRSFRRRYALSSGLSVVLMLLALGALAAVQLSPLLYGDPSWPVAALLAVARWALAGALLLAAVGLLLHLGPDNDQHVGWTSFAALLIVVSWVGASIVFLLYLRNLADYGSAFGALANVVVLLAYLYLSAVVFVTGLEVDVLVRAESTAPG